MYKVIKNGKGNIVAKIVADSINTSGNRITTFELEYPRFIHSELMTHRLFSRNAMSSRAVPVSKMIEQVRNNPATPIHWGKNQSGMQAKTEHTEDVLDNTGEAFSVQDWWYLSAEEAASSAEAMEEAGYHKQIVNRLLEPFQMMKTVLTATEFSNFFWLRLDEDAQPEIHELALCMKSAYDESYPEELVSGEWHTPYVEHYRYEDGLKYDVEDSEGYTRFITAEEAIAISSSCCAQVSYRNIDNSFEKAMKVYERLGVGGSKIHASPFEHVAKPMKECVFDYNNPDLKPEEGITHVDTDQNYWSGNFKGWIQHRQLLENHCN